MAHIILTVADHVAPPIGGFVALARWNATSYREALAAVRSCDEAVPPGAAGDPEVDDFTFILDVWPNELDCTDNGEVCLPLQDAMRLAPEAVQAWLSERPEPDSVLEFAPPVLPGLPTLT